VRRRRLLPAVALLAAGLALSGCIPSGPSAPSTGVILTGYSFDRCAAPSTSAMADWIANSPYRGIGIYLGGASAACPAGGPSNPNLTSAWVNTVENQGWRLLPIYVGSQAPCTSFKHQIDLNSDIPSQGSAQADHAVQLAQSLGIGPGSPIYFDMEGYPRDQSTCSSAVLLFVHGWATRLNQLGYASGFYSSGASGIADEVQNVANKWPYAPPQEIWFAHWNGDGTVPPFGSPYVPDSMWAQHQRHHQYSGGHDETWGATTLNIDSNASDGMVAGR